MKLMFRGGYERIEIESPLANVWGYSPLWFEINTHARAEIKQTPGKH